MCDYSLAGISSRLASVGDQLIVHRFPTGSIGLAPVAALEQQKGKRTEARGWKRCRLAIEAAARALLGSDVCAVCVPPGALLVLRDIPERLQRELMIEPVEDVTFVQLSANSHEYRDGVRFSDGREILLQRLTVGQRVSVLSLDNWAEERESDPVQTARVY